MLALPSVLFVCVKNGGKSQMAAALMRQVAGHRVEIHSAGTEPGSAINALSAEAVAEVGADMSAQVPRSIDPALLRRVDRVVVLGSEAVVEPVEGMVGTIETWETDEPSTHGIDGIARLRLIRDDIKARVTALAAELIQPNEQENTMPEIRVYEPALCCNTGVCGPELDQSLVTFTADLDHLKGLGANVARHNLANDPTAFAENDTVRSFLQVAGSEGLPLTMVDGVTVATGSYPSREQLLRYAGLVTVVTTTAGVADLGLADASAGGCGPTGCC